MRNPIHSHFQSPNWPHARIAAIALRKYQWGLGEDETAIFSENYCIDTCRVSYISDTRHRRGGVAGGKQRRHPLLPDLAGKPEGSVHQGVQRLCGGQRPFGLCNDLLLARRRPLHHLRRADECTVVKGGGRSGSTGLSGRLEKVEGQDRQRRLSDRAFQIGRLADWRRPRQTREAACLPRY